MGDQTSARDLAVAGARVASGMRARDVVVLDMRRCLPMIDYFVLATGTSARQMKGMADRIDDGLSDAGARRRGTEGYREARWILLDFGDVVVRLFDAPTRDYYALEMMWGDAPRVPWQGDEGRDA